MLDGIRLASAVRVNQLHNHQVLVVNTASLRDGQRVALHGLDGAPDIDDLDASLEQLVRFVRKMVRHARERGGIRLVDMHTLHGAAQFPISLIRIR
jgi:hypothetical protein